MNILPFLMICTLLSFNSNSVISSEDLPVADVSIGKKTEILFEDSLKKLEYTCDKLLITETQKKIVELKQTIDKNKSYVLIYKKGIQWFLEKDMTKSISIINASKSDKIVYCEDKIRISGISYPEVKYAVILQ